MSECLRLLAEGLVRAAGSNPDTASDHLPCPLMLGYVSVVSRIRRMPLFPMLRICARERSHCIGKVCPLEPKLCVNSTNVI